MTNFNDLQLPNSVPLRTPLLVTGIAGVAGYNAFQYLRHRHPGEVFGQRRADNWPLHGEGVLACDLEDPDTLAKLFEKHQFQSVLHCGGSCALKSCELDPVMAERVNVDSVRNLISLMNPSTRFVHVSIDLVFGGQRGGTHSEDDFVDPVTIYGKSMRNAELVVESERPDACIMRISLPMGISFNGHAGAIDWIQARFQKQKPATLYFDEIRTPTYCDCLNQVLEAALHSKVNGYFHLGSERQLSLYEIAQIVNRVGGYRPELLMGCYRVQAGPIPPRAGNVSMDSQKIARWLGYNPFSPWPLPDEFVPTSRDWHYDRSGIEGSPELLERILYRNPAKPGVFVRPNKKR